MSWDPLVPTLKVLSQSDQLIHCDIQAMDVSFQFLATFVYGSNSYLERTDLWSSLSQLKSNSPWVVLSDFNALLGTLLTKLVVMVVGPHIWMILTLVSSPLDLMTFATLVVTSLGPTNKNLVGLYPLKLTECWLIKIWLKLLRVLVNIFPRLGSLITLRQWCSSPLPLNQLLNHSILFYFFAFFCFSCSFSSNT